MTPTTIMVDANKGVALHQIGVYSEKFVESIFHTFIPYNNLCVDSPQSDACEYVQSTNPDIVEIGTIISNDKHLETVYDKENISYAIQENLRQILLYQKVDKFITKAKSIIYFVDNHFYVSRTNSRPIVANLNSSSTIANQQLLIHRAMNPTNQVLEQVFNKKVGYDFLTEEQIVEIISLAVPMINETLNMHNRRESIDAFTDMIVGQSVYALKACSIRENEHSWQRPACIVVSTIIRQLPIDSASIYQVYQLIPLPVSFKGDKYAYTDLPKVFGFNNIKRKIILFDDEYVLATCTLSKIVYCRNAPVSISLSALPCLDQLLNSESSFVSMCQITRSKDTQPNILHIQHNVWYMYAGDQSFQCATQSLSGTSSDVVSIVEPMLVTFPCNRLVRCANVELPRIRCDNYTIRVYKRENYDSSKHSASVILFNNITSRLVSIYKTAAKNQLLELQMEIDTNEKWIKRILKEFGSILTISCLLAIISFATFVIKAMQAKLTNKINKLAVRFNRMERDSLEEFI